MTSTFYERLSGDFEKIFKDSEKYDAVIEVGEFPMNQSYAAHSIILRHRCPSLYKELNEIALDTSDANTIKKPNISVKTFNIIIKYIYSGTINLEKVEISTVADLLSTAYEFSLEELVIHLQSFLIKDHASWLRLNFSKCYNLSFRDDRFKMFQQFYNDIIVKHPQMVFDSEEYTSLSENALASLLKRDDLQLEEVKIWRHIIQWGRAQNQGLPNIVEEWNDENFKTLGSSLQKCLPHIRYFQIPRKNIIKDLKPYKKILPPCLLDDLAQKIIAPQLPVSSTILPARNLTISELPTREVAEKSSVIIHGHTARGLIISEIPVQAVSRKSSVATYEYADRGLTISKIPVRKVSGMSRVITYEHAAQISSWIDKITYGVENNPYKFDLLIRGSQDGFDYSKFWEKCDNKNRLVVVLEVEQTGEILGGYNPIGWNKMHQSYSRTNDSFIFSLKTNGTSDSIISRVVNPQRAIKNLYHGQAGPTFGLVDLVLEGNFRTAGSGYCLRHDYEKPIRSVTTRFSVKDYEVFQIGPRT